MYDILYDIEVSVKRLLPGVDVLFTWVINTYVKAYYMGNPPEMWISANQQYTRVV